MKKTIIFIGGLLFTLVLHLQVQAQSSVLFNGKDLSGWVIENNGQFSVVKGVIKVNRGTGWLRSKESFRDFKMTMKFRFLESSANSGIFVRTAASSKDDENGWPDNGYQIQCMDTLDGQYPLANIIPYGAPPFEHQFNQEALKKAYKPTGKWQTYEITCRGETMEIKLNKTTITTATSIKNLEGHVGIQGEHGLLEFRKIKLVRL
jgi:hypothetical protein